MTRALEGILVPIDCLGRNANGINYLGYCRGLQMRS